MNEKYDKFDFILELLNNNKLNTTQRENILHLSALEIKKEKDVGDGLEERVRRIEELLNEDYGTTIETVSLFGHNNFQIENNNENIESKTTKYLDPYTMYEYLFEFNQNKILKYTCHEVDDNALSAINEYCNTETYDFKKHLTSILTAFEEHDKKFNCKSSTKALIRGYITGKDYYNNQLKNGWSSDRIKINWSDNSLQDWALNNNIPPNSSQELFKAKRIKSHSIEPFTSKLFNKRIQTFKELVLYFKCLFHIRADNSLKSILCNINEQNGFTDKVIFHIDDDSFPSNIQLFTDVDKLVQAYIKFVRLIIEQHLKETTPEVKLSFYEIENRVCLSIHHINNTFNKTIQNVLERPGTTITDVINLQLNGVCNIYLKADFGKEGNAEINLWNGKPITVKKGNSNTSSWGVEYILELCKK